MYKIKVKGRQKACYALVNMMPLYSYEKEYLTEEGTEDDFTLVFKGDCKWSVSSYTSPMTDPKPFTEEELDAVEDGDHWDKNLRDKSILLDCEIFCNSKDIDDSCWAIYEHYDRGRVIRDECPKELHIKRGRDYDCYDDFVVPINLTPTEIGRKCKVKFEKGAYYYSGDFEVGDLVYSDGAKDGNLGRIISVEDNVNIHGLYKIKEKVGHADPFVEEDIEAIWKSYKPKERKEYLAKMGLDEGMNKKKFISVMDYKWTKFAAKENNWKKFVELLAAADWEFAKL
jgi:hypothetical protein